MKTIKGNLCAVSSCKHWFHSINFRCIHPALSVYVLGLLAFMKCLPLTQIRNDDRFSCFLFHWRYRFEQLAVDDRFSQLDIFISILGRQGKI